MTNNRKDNILNDIESDDNINESKDGIKLIKVISEAGIASRRKCEKFILNGRVRVNNNVILEQSYLVKEGDEVSFDRTIIERETKHYIALYKPMGVVSTTKKLPGQRIITEFFKDIKERLFYAGRLDSESRGIMIITNDGEFANIITHPSYEILKVYDVTIIDRIDSAKLLEASQGISIKGVKYSPFKFTILSKGRMQSKIRITINEGKNREIRKIFEYLGYRVKDLERISVGIVGKFHHEFGTLTLGQTRRLTEEEINYFFEQKKNVSKKFIDIDDILDEDESVSDLDKVFSKSGYDKGDGRKYRKESASSGEGSKERSGTKKKKQNRDKWAKAKPKNKLKFKSKKAKPQKKEMFLEDREHNKKRSKKSYSSSSRDNKTGRENSSRGRDKASSKKFSSKKTFKKSDR